MTEAELAMEEKLKKKKEEDEAMWQEYIQQWRKQRAKEEEELKKLKERQAKRKVTRAEQEKRMMQLKRKQEEARQREIEEKKQKEIEAKRKRLEEAEKKRQAMLEEQKKQKEGVKPNFVIQKKGQAEAAPVTPAAFDKMSVIDQARSELLKSKEQLAEEKQIALTYRIKNINIEGLSAGKLKDVAEEYWSRIVVLESEKYDLEEKMKRQDYDLRELTERQRQINRQKALKKGIDPAEAEGKYPPKVHVASKFERRVDRRTYGEKKNLFDGGLEKTLKEQLEKCWSTRMTSFKDSGHKNLPKWDPTAPKVKEVIEQRTYDDDDDLLDLQPPGLEDFDEPEPEPAREPSPPPEEEEEEEEEEEDEEEEEEE